MWRSRQQAPMIVGQFAGCHITAVRSPHKTTPKVRQSEPSFQPSVPRVHELSASNYLPAINYLRSFLPDVT